MSKQSNKQNLEQKSQQDIQILLIELILYFELILYQLIELIQILLISINQQQQIVSIVRMVSEQLIDSIAIVLSLVMYVLWANEVFTYLKNKFNINNSNINTNTINKQNMTHKNQNEDKDKDQDKDKDKDKDNNKLHTENNNTITFIDKINNIVNTSVIDLLFSNNNNNNREININPIVQLNINKSVQTHNKSVQTHNKSVQTHKQSNTFIYNRMLSFVMTFIMCVLLFSVVIQERLIQSICQHIYNMTSIMVTPFIGYQLNQKNPSLSLMSSQHTLYINQTTDRINIFHLIANLTLLIKIFHSPNNNKTNYKTTSKHLQQQQYKVLTINKSQTFFRFVINLIMIITNPSFIAIIFMEFLTHIINSQDKQQFEQQGQQIQQQQLNPSNLKLTSTLNHSSSLLLILLLFPILLLYLIKHPQQFTLAQHYQQTIFPQLFTPQSNLIWILYAHMFNRYLYMYQLIMFILPLCFAFPLSLLKITYGTKLTCLYFVIIFTSYNCTNLDIFIFWVMVFLNIQRFSSFKDPLMKKINKSLGVIAFVGSSFFFLVYEKIVSFYLTTWMVNIGYPFVFGCLAWALIAIWLSELIKIQLQQIFNVPYQSKQTGKLTKIKENLKGFIKNKLWTKTN